MQGIRGNTIISFRAVTDDTPGVDSHMAGPHWKPLEHAVGRRFPYDTVSGAF